MHPEGQTFDSSLNFACGNEPFELWCDGNRKDHALVGSIFLIHVHSIQTSNAPKSAKGTDAINIPHVFFCLVNENMLPAKLPKIIIIEDMIMAELIDNTQIRNSRPDPAIQMTSAAIIKKRRVGDTLRFELFIGCCIF